MKATKITYPVSGSFTLDGESMDFKTQLYKIGVYIIWNNNSSLQGGATPASMAKLHKKLLKDKEKGFITNLELGRMITVTDETGFWEEQ